MVIIWQVFRSNFTTKWSIYTKIEHFDWFLSGRKPTVSAQEFGGFKSLVHISSQCYESYMELAVVKL